jgi:hypothetical protein
MTLLRGSLVVAGAGIRTPAQVTMETVSRIRTADIVFSLVADPLAEYWIRSLNGAAKSLAGLYTVGKPRWQIYDEIVSRIVAPVLTGSIVCAVAYGHPGVFAEPLHRALRVVRAAGHAGEMLAAVSAEDCLFADLGFDPGSSGCRSFEATDYLLFARPPDTSASLVLWQIGVIGVAGVKAQRSAWSVDGLAALRDCLALHYPLAHGVVVYEAAHFSAGHPTIHRCPLAELLDAPVTALSTLFVPPLTKPRYDAEMARRLGIDFTSPAWRGRPDGARA